jgi:hypothetical protein
LLAYRYKRNLETVEVFWERVVLEPNRRAAEELENARNAKLMKVVKPKSNQNLLYSDITNLRSIHEPGGCEGVG